MDNDNDNVSVNLTVSESNINIAMMPVLTFIDLEVFDLDEALAAVYRDSGSLLTAWKTFVLNLPTVNEVTRDDVCSVCMEGFTQHNTDGENKRVPCGHVYHSNCITLWLEHCNSCPLCRRHIPLFSP